MGNSTLVAQSTSRVCGMAIPIGISPAIDISAGSQQAVERHGKGPGPCGRGLTAFADTGLNT